MHDNAPPLSGFAAEPGGGRAQDGFSPEPEPKDGQLGGKDPQLGGLTCALARWFRACGPGLAQCILGVAGVKVYGDPL